MTIKEIKKAIQNTSYCFEKHHDFSGVTDRYKENHDVIVGNGKRIIAENKTRTKWFVSDASTLKCRATGLSLEEALRF